MTIKTQHLLASLILIFLTPPAITNGIGCWGNKYCKEFIGCNQDTSILQKALNQMPDDATAENGKNLACQNGGAYNGINGAICVWVWDTDNTTTGVVVKDRVQRIRDHGCDLCGAAPTVDDGRNDNSKGQVTIGWSWNEQMCNGLCNARGGSDYPPGHIVADAGLPPGYSYDNYHKK